MDGLAEATKKTKKSQIEQLKSVWPQIKELVVPRSWRLITGFILLLTNRVMGLALPYSSKLLLDRVIAKKDVHFLGLLIAGVLLATLIQACTSFALTQLLGKEGQRAIAELRRRVQAHIGRLTMSFYDSNKTGSLVSRIMSDVEGVRNIIGTGLLDFVGSILTAAIVLILMLRISFTMTSIALGILALFFIVLDRAFGVIRPIFRERGRLNAEVTGRLTESLGGVRVVKGYHAESREAQVFSRGIQRILDNVMKTLTAMSAMGLASTLIMGVVGCVIMYLGCRQVIAGTMTAGGLFQYTMFMGYLAAPVFQIASVGTQVTEAVAGLDRTREVLNEGPEHPDPDRTIALDQVQGELSFTHVDFAYETGKPVLEDVSFVAKPDTVTALIGSSGSGKSTIIGLVAAFYKPVRGTVLIDNVDLSRVCLESYRPLLGVVLQESFLFDGSIRDNVAFSRPEATEEEIMSACRVAHVDEFAERFRDRYNTIIGERGVKLSGGQRQRISIARAVLADPKILILDEATSSLDSESEALIQRGLRYLMKGRTTFVIAHRLSTIRQADQILVVEAGHIVERGTHASLYALAGRYYDLYRRQYDVNANLLVDSSATDDQEERQEVDVMLLENEEKVDPLMLVPGQGPSL
ncbi:MAG TPA: ABC transporter ATP-binding protein [Candidatus Angelobacter sp.]|jgi:subfamily B ATP-binding cassette protein MsbA|nr:ABC transporter ATP-binding protein [Candidatus Angelobacter sp.]